MQRHHNGSGRRTVITEDWSAHHRPVMAGTHTATVSLRRPGGTPGVFDPVTGTFPSTPFAAYYTGPARVQKLSLGGAEQIRLAGDQEVSTLGYAVMLDHTLEDTETFGTAVQLDDVCQVTEVDDNGDETLVGRELIVGAIERGSLHWERRLLCTDNLETQEA